ncbi:hypothetical protein QN277_021329 [Acacia crassicarpa]|uniref:Uncharacterized protein n=1 Tax=Acacia crassicarpa TaxID=499986 RepID=A0AAE1JLP5_9FABA|nr:hypothetical protein QN277_021329 [Acacia crassicarpa]
MQNQPKIRNHGLTNSLFGIFSTPRTKLRSPSPSLLCLVPISSLPPLNPVYYSPLPLSTRLLYVRVARFLMSFDERVAPLTIQQKQRWRHGRSLRDYCWISCDVI